MMPGEVRQAETFDLIDVCSQVLFKHAYDAAWTLAEAQLVLEFDAMQLMVQKRADPSTMSEKLNGPCMYVEY